MMEALNEPIEIEAIDHHCKEDMISSLSALYANKSNSDVAARIMTNSLIEVCLTSGSEEKQEDLEQLQPNQLIEKAVTLNIDYTKKLLEQKEILGKVATMQYHIIKFLSGDIHQKKEELQTIKATYDDNRLLFSQEQRWLLTQDQINQHDFRDNYTLHDRIIKLAQDKKSKPDLAEKLLNSLKIDRVDFGIDTTNLDKEENYEADPKALGNMLPNTTPPTVSTVGGGSRIHRQTGLSK